MVTICYESILRCGNRLELGYIHALETSPWNSGVLRWYVNMGYLIQTWLGSLPHLPGLLHLKKSKLFAPTQPKLSATLSFYLELPCFVFSTPHQGNSYYWE